jgi:Tol biopolymer transport system component
MRSIVVVITLLMTLSPAAESSRQETSNGGPAVSPDGKWIAFSSNRTGAPDLYVMPAQGGGERQLTSSPEREGPPQWSGDGALLYYAVDQDEQSRLFAVDVQSGQSTQVGVVRGRSAVVSPDGKRVAFTAGTWQQSALGIANIDGTNVRIVTTADQTTVAWNQRFSPDGAFVAFTGQDAARQLHICVVGVDGSGFRRLTTFTADQGRAQVPSWSADGRRVAFQLSRKGWSRIWQVGIDGTGARELLSSQGTFLDEVPSWFPDGRVAFQSTRSGRMEIWTANGDGTAVRQLTGVGSSRLAVRDALTHPDRRW